MRNEIDDLLQKELLYMGHSPSTRKAFQAARGEIGRLRAIVRVNLMRCEGATHEEIDRILDGSDAVSTPSGSDK